MKTPIIQNNFWIILANGTFPTHRIPLSFLHSAEKIICCDGAVENLLSYGLKPNYIIGDMDSISPNTKKCFTSQIISDFSQEKNDLTKALEFCCIKKKKLLFLGQQGKEKTTQSEILP